MNCVKNYKESGKLELLDELFEQVKPGLSSYAEDIPGAIKSIDDLLQHAKGMILFLLPSALINFAGIFAWT